MKDKFNKFRDSEEYFILNLFLIILNSISIIFMPLCIFNIIEIKKFFERKERK